MSDHPALLSVHTTVASVEDARRLARSLVERRLAACAQIEAIESVYRWQGVLHQEPEWRIVCKTTADRYPALQAAIRELHPYELPALHALPVGPVDEAYAQWVVQQVAEPLGDAQGEAPSTST